MPNKKFEKITKISCIERNDKVKNNKTIKRVSFPGVFAVIKTKTTTKNNRNASPSKTRLKKLLDFGKRAIHLKIGAGYLKVKLLADKG